MPRNQLSNAVALLVFFAAGQVAFSQDVKLASYDDLLNRMHHMEQQVQAQGQELQSLNQAQLNQATAYAVGRGSFFAKYEAVVAQPFFSRNDAFQIVDADVQIGSVVINDEGSLHVPFRFDLSFSSRVEFGYLAPTGQMGWRARYWHFDDDAQEAFVADANFQGAEVLISDDPDIDIEDSDALIANHRLNLYVIDLEATRQSGNITYGGGLRFSEVKHQAVWTSDDDANLIQNIDFVGIGPTVSMESQHQIGNTRMNGFTNLRGSVLFGQSDRQALGYDNLANFQSGDVDDYVHSDNDYDVMPVGNLQMGVDWARPCGNGQLFLRSGIEAQIWMSGGSAHVEMNGGGTDDYADNSQNEDLGFFGSFFSIGFIR